MTRDEPEDVDARGQVASASDEGFPQSSCGEIAAQPNAVEEPQALLSRVMIGEAIFPQEVERMASCVMRLHRAAGTRLLPADLPTLMGDARRTRKRSHEGYGLEYLLPKERTVDRVMGALQIGTGGAIAHYVFVHLERVTKRSKTSVRVKLQDGMRQGAGASSYEERLFSSVCRLLASQPADSP